MYNMNMLARTFSAIALIAGVAACSLQSQSDFDSQPFELVQTVPRNYQAAYRNIVKAARECWGFGPIVSVAPSSIELETELYPDLGYGEVYSFMSGTVFMPYALVRVEKVAEGSKISVKTGPQAASERLYLSPPAKWAMGDMSCGHL
ncbi:MAG: hypothetical protein ACRBBS_09680 [Thalassovita sp.]